MSQRRNNPGEWNSMSPTDEQHRDVPPACRSPPQRSDGGSFRRPVVPTSDGRASGEFEGSTLGSSSREGNRRTPSQRRTQSSSGFLLDSLPRSKSSRIGSFRFRPSEPPTEKRTAPEGDIVVPKKRSRFPWGRHKSSASVSTQAPSISSLAAPQQSVNPPPDVQPSGTSSRATSGTHDGDPSAAPGMDRDSLQIVNLALNLNESRRRTASGLASGPNGRRPISVSQPAAAPLELHPPAPRGNTTQRDASYRIYTQIPGDGMPGGTQLGGKSPVVDFLPSSAANDKRVYEFSERTLARADRARRHFELFHEYLRLLPSLPPLRKPQVTDDSDSPDVPPAVLSTDRAYNPLQMIRNRRVRYREKCSIDPEADGWHDVEKVHDWVNSIQNRYSEMTRDEMQILKLPSFQQGPHRASHGELEDLEMTVSPSASLRRISRTNSIKTARPRLDWTSSPAELLADIAWLEDGANKAKAVDKDGNKLYPDLAALVVMDNSVEHAPQIPRLSIETLDPHQEDLSSHHTSLSSTRPALQTEFKSVGQGRHKHRYQSHSHNLRSRSASSSRKGSQWDKFRMRTGSVSSDFSPERRKSSDRNRQAWGHSRHESKSLLRKEASNISEPRISRVKSSAAAVVNSDKTRPQKSGLPSASTKASQVGRKASFSSAGSLDDRYNPRMSLEVTDSTAPNSPAHAGYFPSIAVNLSPPSSRSPSPAKKGLRHKIVTRHERSKSKQDNLDARGHEDESLDTIESHPSISPPEQTERPSKLDPSPLPDIVSSSYVDDHGIADGRVDGYRGRKGPNLPESKLRGIFKGPGRIAEIVGNEVSKVGDLILKKDLVPDSRKSSSATTAASEYSDSDDDKKPDKRSGAMGLLRRLPTLTDEPGRLMRRNSEKGTSKTFMSSLPTFTSPLRQDDRTHSTDAIELGSPRDNTSGSRRPDEHEGPKRMALSRSKTLDFGPALHPARGRRKTPAIQDPSHPFSLNRPPVTGLAQARASPGPPVKTPPLSGATRAWSISDRSLHTLNDSGVPGKTEIERTRTLLLASGIKAREITRRARTSRDPPHWLRNSMGSSSTVPRVARFVEFDAAAQNLLRRFEMTQYSFQQSMHHFSTATSTPLRSQLKDLETLINQTLTPRVRATADDAEGLCVQLNTTSTLAVKSLSDALDKGVRKRRRRLRWVRRTGFVLLEWALVGMLWWVWLIVMVFKLARGVFRGAFSGARWILWL
ncbi:uncharacterized protein N7482_001123 [Penicillium canariense]|uniref:Uncharacterized protein n=1 Tax=Penicillium canariense TaxID=189055 RepID=A0A9W9IGK6_9EURO|nr:uncharacterized protein N7482_001123 [Penicillium canariense]KAJ5175246.1 hypothetical protein N7482_001123 [Penicillium canariense]